MSLLLKPINPQKKVLISRIRTSSFPEVVYRVIRILRKIYLQYRIKNRQNPFHSCDISQNDLHQLKCPDLFLAETNADPSEMVSPECLNLDADVISKIEYELKNTHVSTIKPKGIDIRQLWEPARLQHITTTLVLFFQVGKNDNEFSEIIINAKNDLMKWIQDNPFLLGPHYMSAMECGLRIPVFFFALKRIPFIDSSDTVKILQSIYTHGWWIYRNLSLYSSRGNHTLCEACGLIFAGALFKEHKEGRQWLKQGIQLFEQECYYQIQDDGGPIEQSFAYHRFVVDVLSLGFDFLDKNALYKNDMILSRLKLAEEFIDAVTIQGHLLQIGDSDDGKALSRYIIPKRYNATRKFHDISHFNRSGYTIIRTGNGMALCFDHGPLGMAPLFNHGHADALSLEVYYQGTPLIVDTGTYMYNGDPHYRSYFRGTSAHNTITVDQMDQADQLNVFQWGSPYQISVSRVYSSQTKVSIEASHTGYTRLKNPVIHTRRIDVERTGRLSVLDSFQGKGVHECVLRYHLHPDCELERSNKSFIISNDDKTVLINLSGDMELIPVKGQDEPLQGWFSPEYGRIQPTTTLLCRHQGLIENLTFSTQIHPM